MKPRDFVLSMIGRAKISGSVFRRGHCKPFKLAAACLFAGLLFARNPAFAGSATWLAAPSSGDWSSSANWTAGGPPNSNSDAATFGATNTTGVTIPNGVNVNGITFNASAPAYTIIAAATTPTAINGAGVTNNSANTQNFVINAGAWVNNAGVGIIRFNNSATAGSLTSYTLNGGAVLYGAGGNMYFYDTSSADHGTYSINGGLLGNSYAGPGGAWMSFNDRSTAGNGTFTVHGGAAAGASNGGGINFSNNSDAGYGVFTVNSGDFSGASNGGIYFSGSSTANHGTFTLNGGAFSGASGGFIRFDSNSSAEHGTFTINGGTGGSGANGGSIAFNDSSRAGNASFILHGGTNGGNAGFILFGDGNSSSSASADHGNFIINGGAGSGDNGAYIGFNDASTSGSATITVNGGLGGARGGFVQFSGSSTAGAATLIVNGGSGGKGGGTISFFDHTAGGTARVEVFGNGALDLSLHSSPGLTVGSIEGDGLIYLGSHNLTVGANNLSTEFSGIIEESSPWATGHDGSLTKTGTGTLTLSGNCTYTGATLVNEGALIVNGTLAGEASVAQGATLGGNTTFLGGLANNGTLSPGNSPGTTIVSGNYTQGSTGTLLIQIASLSSFDQLIVTGSASLGGVLHVVKLNHYSPQNGDEFVFLTAGAGVSGSFADVSTGTALGMKVLYSSTTVTLEQFQQDYKNFARTFNQSAVAVALNKAAGNPSQSALIAYLNAESTGRLPGDFDLIAPDELTSIFTIGFSEADIQNTNIERHLEQVRNGASGYTSTGFTATARDGKAVVVDGKKVVVDKNPAASGNGRWSFFLEGSGEFVGVNNTNNASGYDFTTAGVTFGVDYRVNENFAIGITGGYANSNAGLVNQGGINMNSGKGGVYATVFGNGFYADALVGAGCNSYDITRSSLGGYAYGNTGGWDFDLLLNGGYDFHKGGLTFGPIVSLAFTQVNLDQFTETGSLSPLTYPNQSQSSLRSNLGAKISYAAKFNGITVTPEARVSWQHEYLDSTQSIGSQLSGGPVFTVNGPQVGRDSAQVGAGVSVQVSPTVSVYSYYDGQLGRRNFSSNTVSGGVKIDF